MVQHQTSSFPPSAQVVVVNVLTGAASDQQFPAISPSRSLRTKMIQKSPKSIIRTITSRVAQEIPKFHSRRRQRKLLLTVLFLISFVLIHLAISSYMFKSNQTNRNVPLLDNVTNSTFSQSDVMKSMLFYIQSILKSSNLTSFKPGILWSHGELLDNVATPCGRSRLSTFISTNEVTIIYSLHKISSYDQALYYLQQSFHWFPKDLTNDVIITADISLAETDRLLIEETVQNCDICRLFFLHGTIYEQRNVVSSFARGKFLVFLDGRVQVTKGWLRHLMVNINNTKQMISPMLQLTSPDGSMYTTGLAVNEIQWDLTVARGNAGQEMMQKALRNNSNVIPQTVLTKEVFLVSRQFFNELGQFDTRPNVTGSEHVMFSLKALSCGGEILVSLCSTVYLSVSPGTRHTYTDYYSPTFDVYQEVLPSRMYSQVVSVVFLDTFTSRYYTCVDHVLDLNKYRPELVQLQHDVRFSFMRYQSVTLSPIRQKNKLEQAVLGHMKSLACQTKNLKSVLFSRQPGTVSPTKLATFYGYIRTMDGLWAVGVLQSSLGATSQAANQSSWTKLEGKLVLTRNSSLWVGPFSYTNGAFIYQHKLCLTLLPSQLFSLSNCVAGTTAQLFTFTHNVIRTASQEASSACAVLNSNISNPVYMGKCNDKNCTNKFKLDVQFRKGCIH
ncbi:hypothetical protein Btru_049846 [Bulinus truncatus]|nr:hypothetical protein Btru_049846 [Bulinus truncatus]